MRRCDKIPLEIKRWKGLQVLGHRATAITASLPFIQTQEAHVHRVRRGTLFWHGGVYSHTAMHLWCGNTSFPGSSRYKRKARFVARPEIGHTVCLHCELKATAAGHPSSEQLAGHPVATGLSRPPRRPKKP